MGPDACLIGCSDYGQVTTPKMFPLTPRFTTVHEIQGPWRANGEAHFIERTASKDALVPSGDALDREDTNQDPLTQDRLLARGLSAFWKAATVAVPKRKEPTRRKTTATGHVSRRIGICSDPEPGANDRVFLQRTTPFFMPAVAQRCPLDALQRNCATSKRKARDARQLRVPWILCAAAFCARFGQREAHGQEFEHQNLIARRVLSRST